MVVRRISVAAQIVAPTETVTSVADLARAPTSMTSIMTSIVTIVTTIVAAATSTMTIMATVTTKVS